MRKIPEDIKEIVIARLDMIPPNKKISIGSHGAYTKDELIESVKKGDEVGQMVVQIQMSFLRSLKEGKIYG